MLCEKCKQREANVHFTQIINNNIYEKHLCQSCAQEEGMFSSKDSFNVGDIFSGFFQTAPNITKSEAKCSLCGTTFAEFQRTGKLGCSECFTQFESSITPYLKKIHGNALHVGRIPENSQGEYKTKRRLSELKTQLQKAILNEEYEEAAQLRDQIRDLEG